MGGLKAGYPTFTLGQWFRAWRLKFLFCCAGEEVDGNSAQLHSIAIQSCQILTSNGSIVTHTHTQRLAERAPDAASVDERNHKLCRGFSTWGFIVLSVHFKSLLEKFPDRVTWLLRCGPRAWTKCFLVSVLPTTRNLGIRLGAFETIEESLWNPSYCVSGIAHVSLSPAEDCGYTAN